MKTMGFSLDAPAMIKEVARNLTQQGWGVVGAIMGLQLLLELLVQIAQRAYEIDDAKLIAILDRVGITKQYIGRE
jgi:hypothetical protein